jgi:murein DD-endopeptidase MepM/ murein hydrolase activator NlpD
MSIKWIIGGILGAVGIKLVFFSDSANASTSNDDNDDDNDDGSDDSAHQQPAGKAGIGYPYENKAYRITGDWGRQVMSNGRQRHHKGVDIWAPKETPILAAYPGTVVFAGVQDKWYGNTVRLRHTDKDSGQTMYTVYAHCREILVSVGDEVSYRQPIAKTGGDADHPQPYRGNSAGSHCHMELRIGADNRASAVDIAKMFDSTAPDPLYSQSARMRISDT